jgi:hypothetical protein
MTSATAAKAKLKRKAGKNIGTPYYAVGVEREPRDGATTSWNFTVVPSARAGAKLLRKRLKRAKVGRAAELFLYNGNSEHRVSLLAGVREKGGKVFCVDGNTTVGQVRRHYTPARGARK